MKRPGLDNALLALNAGPNSAEVVISSKHNLETEVEFSYDLETDDFLNLWRSSPAGLDDVVETLLDNDFANMAGPSCWGIWNQSSDEQSGDALDDDFWVAPPPVSTDPAADNHALANAIAVGDAHAAGKALEVGGQRCGALWACEGLELLQSAGLALAMSHALAVVQLFGSEARADLAADFWLQWHEEALANACAVAVPEPELYAATLEVCARCMDFEAASRVASRVGWRSPSSFVGRRAMLALVRWLARRQEFSQAWSCYQDVRSQGHSADLATHKAVLSATVRGTNMSLAAEVFEDLLASGLDVDDVAFATMVGGYCVAGAFSEAMFYFDRMRKYDLKPTTALFDTMINGCLRCDAPAVLEQVFAEMKADGVQPSSVTVEALVRYHGRDGDVDRVLAICEELPRRHDFKLDSRAFGALISVCLAGSRLDLALLTVQKMVAQGFVPSARCYESLVLAALRQGDLDQAVQFVDDALGCSAISMPYETVARPRRRPGPLRRLEPRLLEEVLQLIGRKRQVVRLGVPLVTRLEAIGVDLSEQLTASLFRAAELEAISGAGHEHPVLHQRHKQYQCWRDLVQ